MEIELFSSDQFRSNFLHLFQCMGKCIGSYNTAIAQSCSGALNNLEIADSISVDKWQLNECKKNLTDSLFLWKGGDNNVFAVYTSHDDSHCISLNSTFQMCLYTLSGKKIYLFEQK